MINAVLSPRNLVLGSSLIDLGFTSHWLKLFSTWISFLFLYLFSCWICNIYIHLYFVHKYLICSNSLLCLGELNWNCTLWKKLLKSIMFSMEIYIHHHDLHTLQCIFNGQSEYHFGRYEYLSHQLPVHYKMYQQFGNFTNWTEHQVRNK